MLTDNFPETTFLSRCLMYSHKYAEISLRNEYQLYPLNGSIYPLISSAKSSPNSTIRTPSAYITWAPDLTPPWYSTKSTGEATVRKSRRSIPAPSHSSIGSICRR